MKGQGRGLGPFSRGALLILLAIGVLGAVAPFAVPALVKQLIVFWVMVIVAYTWDTMGGQMGYNSFGNVIFFGVGMYASAIIQIAPYTDIAAYTAAGGEGEVLVLDAGQYYRGLAVGVVAAGLAGLALAVVVGSGILGLRGVECTLLD